MTRRRAEPAAEARAEAALEARAERLAERLRRKGHMVTLAGAVSEALAADLIGVSPRTLRGWRRDARGPRAYVSGRAWYPLTEIVAYLEKSLGSTRQHAASDGSARQIQTSTPGDRPPTIEP